MLCPTRVRGAPGTALAAISRNTPSGSLIANVDKLILEAGYGCTVELVPGATVATFTSMESKGQPDIASELWTNAVREPLAVALESGALVTANAGPNRLLVKEFPNLTIGKELKLTFQSKTKRPPILSGIEVIDHAP